MPLSLRILLILGALFALAFFLYQIRKKHLQIDYAIYWILLSILLLVASIIPNVVIGLSRILGFESPANFVFLVLIFLLLVRLFMNTLKLSSANRQITYLTQQLALLKKSLDARMEKGAPDENGSTRGTRGTRDGASDSKD
jgi:hypothetical protein